MKLKSTKLAFYEISPLKGYNVKFKVYLDKDTECKNKTFNKCKLNLEFDGNSDISKNLELYDSHIGYINVVNIKTDESFLVPAIEIWFSNNSKTFQSTFICTNLTSKIDSNKNVNIIEDVEQFAGLTTSVLKDYLLTFELSYPEKLPYDCISNFELQSKKDIKEYFNN